MSSPEHVLASLTFFRCVNLLAVLLWSLTTDKLGRRTIFLPCQTLLVVILFVVGGLHFSGATTTNATAGTALVSIISEVERTIWLTCQVGHLLLVDILLPSHCDVAVRLLGGTPVCPFEE